MKKLLVPMIIIAAAIAYGYTANVVKTFSCDFEAPYKCEVLRVGGVAFPPAGVVFGYINFGK